MNTFSMTRRCVSKLEKYVFDRVWNEPYSEYRTNTRPRILNRIVEVSSGSSDNYGNDISTKQYASAAGVLTCCHVIVPVMGIPIFAHALVYTAFCMLNASSSSGERLLRNL